MEIDETLFSEKLPIINMRWSIAMYYRLAIVDLLPGNVERIWYLDDDGIVNKSLYEISVEMNNEMLALLEKMV